MLKGGLVWAFVGLACAGLIAAAVFVPVGGSAGRRSITDRPLKSPQSETSTALEPSQPATESAPPAVTPAP